MKRARTNGDGDAGREYAEIWGEAVQANRKLRTILIFLSASIVLGHDPSRGAAYVEGWIKSLEEDPREIRRAAADAQRISDFVLARHIERGQARESAAPTREPMAVAATRAPGLQRIQVPVPQIPTPRRGAGPSR